MRAIAFALSLGFILAQEPDAPKSKSGMNPEARKKAQEWNRKMGRGEGKLQPGDPAPDFDLKKLRSPDRVRLSSFHGKRPVALVFGSYT